MSNNQKITAAEMAHIRSLEDFDLTMFISEINDHGWEIAKETLKIMPKGGLVSVRPVRGNGRLPQ